MKKVVLVVLDSLGVGEMPDSKEFGDLGSNTFLHVVEKNPNLRFPNLSKLGFCNIPGIENENFICDNPLGIYGKLKELSNGKDTITGHWEICGIISKIPFKTYPNGFPKEFMDEFCKEIGIEALGNCAESGTEIINRLGEEHEKTKRPIVYTSADSVFQIAANVDIVPLEKLYEYCETARRLLVGSFACGRVIARPYTFIDGKRVRTSDRKDYAVSPPRKTLLDYIKEDKKTVYAIGKISDIFNGHGISKSVHIVSNMDGVDKTIEAMKEDFTGLIFTNLVEFDSLYGHRRDPIGYGNAIKEFDNRLPEIIEALGDEDLLVLTADHGNDPTYSGFDHTREHIGAVFVTKKMLKEEKKGLCFDTRSSFSDIGKTIAKYLECQEDIYGEVIQEVF